MEKFQNSAISDSDKFSFGSEFSSQNLTKNKENIDPVEEQKSDTKFAAFQQIFNFNNSNYVNKTQKEPKKRKLKIQKNQLNLANFSFVPSGEKKRISDVIHNLRTQNIHKISISAEIKNKLFDHQITGINFLFDNFVQKKGCILADDMGLGKTCQISTYLIALQQMSLIHRSVIVVPATLIDYWETEIHKWMPKEVKVRIVKIQGKYNQRETLVETAINRKVIIIISPESFIRDYTIIQQKIKWDVLVVDEGHKAKNINTQFRKALKNFRVQRQKIVLTGTPVQNNLVEFYSILDLVQDEILGTLDFFIQNYANPIKRGLQKQQRFQIKIQAQQLLIDLKKIYNPYFLRRTKSEIFKIVSSEMSPTPLTWNQMPYKIDFVVWIPLSQIQKQIYKIIISNSEVQKSIKEMNRQHIFIMILALKQLCVHPSLLLKNVEKTETETLAEDGQDSPETFNFSQLQHERQLDYCKIKESMEQQFDIKSEAHWNQQSSKLNFLMSLLHNLKSQNHKVLIFSKTKVLLNIIQKCLDEENYKYTRLDGDVAISKRDAVCKQFNDSPEIFCFLLTAQVSGVGLNLVGADRAVIVDPDWNPANDNQSIDRCYRIGQKRDVVVYRLISTNSVEESIYKRQVFKQSLSKAAIEDHQDNMIRYFDEGEFKDLLKFNYDKEECETLEILNKKHKFQYLYTPSIYEHCKFLREMDYVEGLTNHGSLFSTQELIKPEDDEHLNVEALKEEEEKDQKGKKGKKEKKTKQNIQ